MLWTLLKYLWILGMATLVVVGIWAIISPKTFLAFNRSSGHLIGIKCIGDQQPAKTHFIDGVIYRFHYIVGAWMILASVAILYYVFAHFDPVFFITNARDVESITLMTILADSLVAMICVAGIIGLIVGSIVFIRPSVLKPVEAWANRWTSLNWMSQYTERNILSMDKWVGQHTRLYGVLVLIAAVLIILTATLPW